METARFILRIAHRQLARNGSVAHFSQALGAIRTTAGASGVTSSNRVSKISSAWEWKSP
jgi:hypothetical protein